MSQVVLVEGVFHIQKRSTDQILVAALELWVFSIVDDSEIVVLEQVAKWFGLFAHGFGASIQAVAA